METTEYIDDVQVARQLLVFLSASLLLVLVSLSDILSVNATRMLCIGLFRL